MEQTDKLETILRDIGLTAKESTIYMALLKLGQATAYAIAEKARIKPPTTYLTLDNLIKKGVVITLPRAKKKRFAVKSPEELIAMYEEKVARAKDHLSDFTSLIPSQAPEIKVSYYQSIRGVRESFYYSHKRYPPSKEIVAFLSNGEHVSEEYRDLSREYLLKLGKRGTRIRGITPKQGKYSDFSKLNSEFGNTIRMIPQKDYSSQVSIEAEDHIVRIIMNDVEKALVIDNTELAHVIRQIFEMVWKK